MVAADWIVASDTAGARLCLTNARIVARVDPRVVDVDRPHRRVLVPSAPAYERTALWTAWRPACAEKRRASARRPTRLAARRSRSHSQGPGQRLVEVVDVEDAGRARARRTGRSCRGGRRRTAGRRCRVWAAARGPTAIGSAAPRKNGNGEAAIRPCRTGPAPGCGRRLRPRAGRPGSGRSDRGRQRREDRRAGRGAAPRRRRPARLRASVLRARPGASAGIRPAAPSVPAAGAPEGPVGRRSRPRRSGTRFAAPIRSVSP